MSFQRAVVNSYTHSSTGGSGAAAAAAALSPGGGCRVGTALDDLAGVEVGDTLFVGEPWDARQTGRPRFKGCRETSQRETDFKKHRKRRTVSIAHLCRRPGREVKNKETQ